MTYCVGLLVDTGLVMLSDSRTNAGVDQINTFRKMAIFQRSERPGAGAHVGGQSRDHAGGGEPAARDTGEIGEADPLIFSATNMFNAARVVGDALREIHERDGTMLKEHGHDFNAHLHLRRPDPGRGAAAVPHLLGRATSSSRRSTRRIFRSASRSTENPSSTG